MPSFTAEVWGAFAFIAVAAVLTCLYALSALVRDRTRLIDLKAQVLQLRKEYEEQTADVMMEDDPEVIRYAMEQVGERAAA